MAIRQTVAASSRHFTGHDLEAKVVTSYGLCLSQEQLLGLAFLLCPQACT